MAAYISELVFNCTLAQFATMCSTTLPAAGFKVIQAPIKFQGVIIQNQAFTFTASSTSTSTALTALSSLAGLYPGIPVTSADIPSPNSLASIGAVNTATLAVAATTTGSSTYTATPNLGQLDFSYDGAFFVRFYGANPVPTGQQAQIGVPVNQMSPNYISVLTNTLAATLGAPVPVNQAVPPSSGAGYYP
jgi:hypothetical protein